MSIAGGVSWEEPVSTLKEISGWWRLGSKLPRPACQGTTGIFTSQGCVLLSQIALPIKFVTADSRTCRSDTLRYKGSRIVGLRVQTYRGLKWSTKHCRPFRVVAV